MAEEASRDFDERTLVLYNPDEKWPIRADGILQSLMNIHKVLEVTQPLVKDMKKKDPAMFKVFEAIHSETMAAMIFLTFRESSIQDAIRENLSGGYFKTYMRGISQATIEEMAEAGCDVSVYKQASHKRIKRAKLS